MNDSIFRVLMQFFATIVNYDNRENKNIAREIVKKYLYEKEFSEEHSDYYIALFEEYLENQRRVKSYPYSDNPLFTEHTLHLCRQINLEFEQNQKVWLLLQLTEFVGDGLFKNEIYHNFISLLAFHFNVDQIEFDCAQQFVLAADESDMPMVDKILVVDSDSNFLHPYFKHHYNEKLSGRVYFIHLASVNTFLIKNFGETNLLINGHSMRNARAYVFGFGSVVRNPKIDPIYYSRIAGKFIQADVLRRIIFVATDVSYKFKGSNDGVYPFNIKAESGQLVGILGGSGVGKSTLLNVLNGSLKMETGRITLNGFDLEAEKEIVRGVIGYVPQDDLLIEELTVYQNLYFNAKLCFRNYTEEELNDVVNQTIVDFDLDEARDFKVGSPLNKYISGGQRKRLNIALELMRQPSVLFVDEPTSGLSSIDSEKVMLLLKRQTLKGKVVIANIHQPSSDLFKLLDKILVMDQGGRVIFQGNPMDGIVYFRQAAHYFNAEESECMTCGNVNAEVILRVVEARVVNEYGKLTRNRKRSAKEWYQLYLKNVQPKLRSIVHSEKTNLPINNFHIPNRLNQFRIFISRSILSKLSDRQYLLMISLEAPLLAIIIGFFTKYTVGDSTNLNRYIFSTNDNIPAYLFMSVVAALFLGMIVSAEEIIKDRKILHREKFLNLSWGSYISSKVFVVFLISAIQMFVFVLLGNHILEIKGMNSIYWMILFSAAACANMIGLNLSSALKSTVAIYVTVPLLLVPQLLFSGVIVDFKKLHHSISNNRYVPFVGDMMISRWAYEALAVSQFKDNTYTQFFYEVDKERSQNNYYSSIYIPILMSQLNELQHDYNLKSINDKSLMRLKLVDNEFERLRVEFGSKVYGFNHYESGIKQVDTKTIKDLKLSLNNLQTFLWGNYNRLSIKKDSIYHSLLSKYKTSERIVSLRHNYENKALSDLVLNKSGVAQSKIVGTEIVQLKDPSYMDPTSSIGKAQFYAPVKIVGGNKIDTKWFNVGVIWLFTILGFIALHNNWLLRVTQYIDIIKSRRTESRISKHRPQ